MWISPAPQKTVRSQILLAYSRDSKGRHKVVYAFSAERLKIFYDSRKPIKTSVVSKLDTLGDGNYQLYIEDSDKEQIRVNELENSGQERRYKLFPLFHCTSEEKPKSLPYEIEPGSHFGAQQLLDLRKFVQLYAIWRSAVFTSVILADVSSFSNGFPGWKSDHELLAAWLTAT